MGNTKQIKDLTLQTGVDGNEDILIQNNGVTKRIKSGEFLTEHQDISHLATKTSVSSLESEVSNLKQSVSDGKELIASAITDKGVNTSKTDSFQTMAANISKISGDNDNDDVVLIYSFEDDVRGNAHGTILLNTPNEDTLGEYSIHWGDDNGVLSEYEEISLLTTTASSNTKTYEFIPLNAIPDNATRIIALHNGVFSADFKIPDSKRLNINDKLFSYGALSDIHIDGDGDDDAFSESDFTKEISYFETNGAVAICNSGDITRDGRECDVAGVLRCIDNTNLPIYTARGNHDNANDCSGLDNELYSSIEPNGNLFLKKINGEIFIFCGILSSSAGETSIFDDAQITQLSTWLETYKDRRVFLHEHVFFGETGNIYNLYGGTGMSNSGNAGEFKKLMRKYRNVILCTGHSHLDFALQRLGDHANINQRTDTLCHRVHIPSASRPRYNDIDTPDIKDNTYTYKSGAQGYLIDVYRDFIILKGRDFIKGKNLPYATYILDTTPISIGIPTPLFYLDASNPNNTSTSAEDLSGNGIDFVMNDITIENGYFVFNENLTSYMINQTYSLSTDTTPKELTLEFVANPRSMGGYIICFGESSPNRAAIRFCKTEDNAMEFYICDNNAGYIYIGEYLDIESHYVVTFDSAGTCTVYRDGKYLDSVGDLYINRELSSNIVIGEKYDLSSTNFDGKIKYFKAYEKCVSSTDAISMYDDYTSNFVNFGEETSTMDELTTTFDNTLITYNGSSSGTPVFLDTCTYVNVPGDFKADITYYVQLIHKGGSVDTTNRPEILDVSVSIDNGATYIIEKDERTLDDVYERIEFEVTNDCNSLLLSIRPKGKMIFNNYAISAVIGEA